MSKTKEELLLTYQKATKDKRAKAVIKAGFTTEAEYLEYLLKPEVTSGSPAAASLFKHNQAPKPTIHNVHIVDISGSMSGSKLSSAVLGVNSEVDELKKEDNVIYTQTLVEFSGPDVIRTVFNKTPMKEVTSYSTRAMGSTALHEAVAETLLRLKSEHNGTDKVLVKIFTDGGENASSGKWYGASGAALLADLIKECEPLGFTVTFIGTKHDVDYAVNTLGVHVSNTMTHDNTGETIMLASYARSAGTAAYANKVLKKKDVSKGFYKDVKNP